MPGELERLEAMYGELGDEHLRDLYDDRESLTADGQIALARVMAAKGMVERPAAVLGADVTPGRERVLDAAELESGFAAGIPGIVPSGAGTVEQALEHGAEHFDGMASLVTFFDGHELTRACDALDAKDVDFAIESQERDGLSGAPSSFAIWVAERDVTTAQSVLRREMGLFPESEMEGTDGPEYDDEPVTLGEFESAVETERVRGLLQGAGIDSTVNQDGSGDFVVEVKGTDLERGLQVVATGMRLE